MRMSRLPSLTQQHYTHSQSFEITPDFYLSVHAKSLTQQCHSRIDLFDLELHPSSLSTSSRPLLFATGFWMLITVIGLCFSFFKGPENYIEWLVIASSLTVVRALLFYLSHKNVIIYYHRQTHQPLVEILTLNQNQTQRAHFIKQLNTLLSRLVEHDRSSFYAQQASNQATKDGLSYN
jgi:hypothetical protein